MLTPCQGTSWHSPVRWKWDVAHPAGLACDGIGAKPGSGSTICRVFLLPFEASSRPPGRGTKELLHSDRGVHLALPGLRAVLCCQGSRDVLGMLPQLEKTPKGSPQGPSITVGWKTANVGANIGALNGFKPKDARLTPEEERRSQTEPILGWCCSLGAQPGAQGVLAATQSWDLLPWAPPSHSRRWGTVHWAQVPSCSLTRAGFLSVTCSGKAGIGITHHPQGFGGTERED